MNEKQKYVLLLLLCGFVISHAMETDHQRFSDEETGNSSEDENTLNHENSSKESFSANSIPTIEIDLPEAENNQVNTLQEINLNESDPIRNETSNESIDTNKKDGYTTQPISKYNPLSWATYLNDLRRGTLENLIHELDNNERFDPKTMSDNMPRVNNAIKEAIINNKADQLVVLIQRLNAIKFPILQEKSAEVVTYLNKAVIQTQDKFVTDTMSKIAQHKKFITEKETEIVNNVLPLLTALVLEINKQTHDIKLDISKTVETLNTYKNVLNILDPKEFRSDYTTQSVLEKTQTEELIHTTTQKHGTMCQNMVKIKDLFVNTIENK